LGGQVCVARGASVPIVLRYQGDSFGGQSMPSRGAGFFTQSGTAYVHGIMDGEAIGEDYNEREEVMFVT
jgi:hypothetical protein